MVNSEIYAYNGKTTKAVKIKIGHIGKKIGDLIHTKYSPMFKIKSK